MIAIVFLALGMLSFHYSPKMTIDSPEMAIDLNENDFLNLTKIQGKVQMF